jgi:hypothetical protein
VASTVDIADTIASRFEAPSQEMVELQKRFYGLYKKIASPDCQDLVRPATMQTWARMNDVTDPEVLEKTLVDPEYAVLFRALLLKALQYLPGFQMSAVLGYSESMPDFFQQLVSQAIYAYEAGYRPVGIIENQFVAAAVPCRTEAPITDLLQRYDVESSIAADLDDTNNPDAYTPDTNVFQELSTLDLEVSAIQFKQVIAAIADKLYADAGSMPGTGQVQSASAVMDLAAHQDDKNLARLRRALVGSKSQAELARRIVSDFIDIGTNLNKLTETVRANGLDFTPNQINHINNYIKKLVIVIAYNLAGTLDTEAEQRLAEIVPMVKKLVAFLLKIVQQQVETNQRIAEVEARYSPNIGKRFNAVDTIREFYDWAGSRGNLDLKMKSKLSLEEYADVEALEVMNVISEALSSDMERVWVELQIDIDNEIIRLEQAIKLEPQIISSAAEIDKSSETNGSLLLTDLKLPEIIDPREWANRVLSGEGLVEKLTQLLALYKPADLPNSIPGNLRAQLTQGKVESVRKHLTRWTEQDMWSRHGESNTRALREFISEIRNNA